MEPLCTSPQVIEETALQTPPNESGYCWPIVVAAFNCLTTIPYFCTSKFCDYLVDGDKPWKQMKYGLCLNALVSAFEKFDIPLNNIKEDFQNKENTSTQAKALLVIETLLEKNTETNTYRNHYRTFIDCLRDALLMEKNNDYRPFLEKVCLYRFTEFHCFDFCETLISSVIKEGIKVTHAFNPEKLKMELNKELYQIALEDQFSYITATPQTEKAPISHLHIDLIRGGCNVGFDAQRRGNIPFALFEFSFNSKTVKVLRSGSPTIQRNGYASFSFEGEASITPEFYGLLDIFLKEEKNLLHISCQDNRERYVGSEKPRNTAFINLLKVYSKGYHLAIFAHDTPFFEQSGEFEHECDAAVFKKEFVKQMESQTDGFFFSESIKDIAAYKKLLDEVHDELYLGKKKLSREERTNFIEIYYPRLTLVLLKKSNADYLMNICKDTIDRAAIRNALLQFFLLISFQKETSGKHLNELYTYLHAGAFIVKKRAVNSRRSRLISCLKLLESEDIKARIRQKKDSLGIEGEDLFIKRMPNPQLLMETL